MNRKHLAKDRVTRYVTTLLKQSSVTKLPSLREIATNCNVCAATVYNVINTLKKQHEIVSLWGHEIRFGKNSSEEISSRNDIKERKWQSIRDLLINDYIATQHKSGMFLPAKKELQFRYNISYTTLSKALKPLIASGKIEYSGGKLRICLPKIKNRWKPKIVVICAGVQPGIPKVASEREREFYQYLTIEASHKYIELEFVIYEDWIDEPVFRPLNCRECSNFPENDAVLGYIVSSWHMKSLADSIYRLLPSAKPIAVWLEHPTDMQTLPTRKQLTYFNIGYSKNAGRDIAEHFLRLGHREIAFLSPFHDSLWSKERLSGIIETFETQDSSYKVHPMVTTSAKSEWDYSEKIMKMPDFINNQKLSDMTKKLPNFFKSRIAYFYDEYFRLFRDSLIIETIKSHLNYIIKNRSITAVIAANDHSALLALDYFKNQGIPVPSRISLAGFDNSFDALVNGITSYSFDTYSMVRAMIGHITNCSNKKNQSKMYLFDGTVIERATTGYRTQ
jgi:DNA-binding LacI/PurR family transcriptional regulator/DNA-binding transcriptional regulator YhcF (GntR family)